VVAHRNSAVRRAERTHMSSLDCMLWSRISVPPQIFTTKTVHSNPNKLLRSLDGAQAQKPRKFQVRRQLCRCEANGRLNGNFAYCLHEYLSFARHIFTTETVHSERIAAFARRCAGAETPKGPGSATTAPMRGKRSTERQLSILPSRISIFRT
jgi:hypothetical protein